jgi:DNA topoisomerase-3
MKRNDVTEVVNACDAGREGELIFRTVYKLSGCMKPMKRLWISSMEDAAILDGFTNLRDGAEYDRLYESALCRNKADWLVGINATRLFSVLYHRTLNVGRVVSPTLALLVAREAEIGAFKSEPFYTVNLDFSDFNAAGEKLADTKEANATADNCRGNEALVVAVERKEKSEKAPALYDLTTLQRDANRILGYTAQQTLDYLQSLYEKKLTTYPRTDSRFSPMIWRIPFGRRALRRRHYGDEYAGGYQPAQVCNSKKVSDHHAVIPTIVAGETDLAALPAGEREVLLFICRQVFDGCERWPIAVLNHRYS